MIQWAKGNLRICISSSSLVMINTAVEETTLGINGLSKKVIWEASEGLTVAMEKNHVR